MQSALKLRSPVPQESCRTDYGSFSLRLPGEDAFDDFFGWVYDLAEKVLPTNRPLELTKGRHYSHLWRHDSGITLESTPVEERLSTYGHTLINIPGACWGSLDAPERRDLIWGIRYWPGFYKCTRWDAQITALNPPISISEVIDQVAAGRLWAARFSTQQAWERRTQNGELAESPTQYFGSAQSDVRLRVYDHGVKWNWQVPSLRVEAQLRKDVADQHFRRCAQRCYDERHQEPLLVSMEEVTVKDTLGQTADFRDTSRWVGRERPKKWRQTAQKPQWWGDMLDHKHEPLDRTHKAELDWDQTMEALKEQYGRKLWLWSRREAATKGMSTAQVLEDYVTSCATKLKKGDDALLAAQVPRGNKQACRDAVRKAGIYAAKKAEGYEA